MQSQDSKDAGEVRHEVNFRLIIGGEEHDWHHESITYEELVGVLFPNGAPDGTYPHSITFVTPQGREGQLQAGESVKVENGMKFYVRSSHKS